MSSNLKERTALALEPHKGNLGKLTLACGIGMVVLGFPAQIYDNWSKGECGISLVLIAVALILYLVRIPYQMSARAWYLVPADALGLIASVVLAGQYIYYETAYSFRDVLNVLAGVIFVIAFVPYIRAILRKETRPTKSTWLIWATLDTITLVGMWQEGAVNGQIIGAVLGAWTVTVLAMKYGDKGWSLADKLCLAGAGVGIGLLLVGNPTLGIVTSLAVVFLGSIPTFLSAWKDPTREDKTAWTIYWISCACAMVAIPAWTLADAGQPTTFFAIETIMMFILLMRPRMLRD
jgi:hypothetical protein